MEKYFHEPTVLLQPSGSCWAVFVEGNQVGVWPDYSEAKAAAECWAKDKNMRLVKAEPAQPAQPPICSICRVRVDQCEHAPAGTQATDKTEIQIWSDAGAFCEPAPATETAREWLCKGGGGHEDGEDGIKACTLSMEGAIELMDEYAAYYHAAHEREQLAMLRYLHASAQELTISLRAERDEALRLLREYTARIAAEHMNVSVNKGFNWAYVASPADVTNIGRMYHELLEAAERQVAELPKWISVKDRLPERTADGPRPWYLVTNGSRCDVAMLMPKTAGFMGHALQFGEITHWQQLPAPPTSVGMGPSPNDAVAGESKEKGLAQAKKESL